MKLFKGFIGIILVTLVVMIGVKMTSMKKVSADEISKKSTVVGNLDIVDLYMDDLYDSSKEQIVEGKEKRTIRIWTPKEYNANDKSKKYSVLYMHDGQNLFDDATSYCGEWGIDETITEFMEHDGYEGTIVVGIDNSVYREPEMKPAWDTEDSLADRYSDFIINKVKTYVDANYNTYTDREHTGIGGSSMGGLISFYMGLKHPEVFDYEVCFSPAFCFVTEKQVADYMVKHDVKNKDNPRIYMYCGGSELDGDLYGFVEPFKDNLIKNGYKSDLIKTCIDMKQVHNEGAWRTYFKPAYAWLLNIK